MTNIILACVITFLIGMLVDELIVHLHKSFGVLRIDDSNPEKDIYRIELDDIENLANKKIIMLKVDNHADLSQK